MKFLQKIGIAFLFIVLMMIKVEAQLDTIYREEILDGIIINAYRYPNQNIQHLDDIKSTYVFIGKKTEVIDVSEGNITTALKTGRQVFAKVPGAFIYDMDGSGNQMNFATRGLDPHRSWEYNVRQNGVLTNSDIYGYPASHYSPPFESIEKIEIVRGTASLQYGAQFGGMINYITKAIDTSKIFSLENIATVGSYGLLSNYTAINGKKNKLTYYAYFHKRVVDGYRENAKSNAQSQFFSLQYEADSKLKLIAEFGRSKYLYKIPGPLTDKMFYDNPRQATRSRNYFSPDIYLPSIKAEYKLNDRASFTWMSSAVLGNRSSVQFIGFADTKDTINHITNQYKNRQVDIDNFNSYTTELRCLQKYSLLGLDYILASGIRYISNDLHRRQLGIGTTGTDYDLTITNQGFGRDVHFTTKNIAAFIENTILLTSNLTLTPGIRIEEGISKMTGVISYLPDEKLPKEIIHSYVLSGITSQYKFNEKIKLYGGWSQAYRPVIFADIIPGSPIELVNENMLDAKGSNAELGIKAKSGKRLQMDLTYFKVEYNNRIGNMIIKDENGNSSIYKTNIGDSRTQGIEVLVNYRIVESAKSLVSIFTSTSYMHGKYKKGSLRLGNENIDITNHLLETTPKWISRNGLNVGYKRFNSTLLFSYVSDSYSDALNTEMPTTNGAAGIVPEYNVLDFNFSYTINKHLNIKCNLNNMTNAQYFTKRPTGYPGVGVWSSDGRNMTVSISVKL